MERVNCMSYCRKVCALTNANAAFPSLFSNVSSNCKLIAVKSRQLNKRDLEFIADEISRLSSERIIQPSVSPWWEQIAAVKNAESDKRRMCIDHYHIQFIR